MIVYKSQLKSTQTNKMSSAVEQFRNLVKEVKEVVSSTTPTLIKTIAYVRQNAWGKASVWAKNYTVLTSKKLTAPYGHTRSQYKQFRKNRYIEHHSTREFDAMSIGSYVYLPPEERGGGNTAYILLLTSATIAGKHPDLVIVTRPRTCGHKHTRPSHEEAHDSCMACGESVVAVVNKNETEALETYRSQGCLIESFYTLYREIEVVGQFDVSGLDKRSFASHPAFGKHSKHWKEVAPCPAPDAAPEAVPEAAPENTPVSIRLSITLEGMESAVASVVSRFASLVSTLGTIERT